MHQKANIFAHVKNLKPYHVSTNFQTFHHNLQKQGGDTNYFDDQEDKEKFEKSDMKNTQKTQKPREEFKDEKDHTDEEMRQTQTQETMIFKNHFLTIEKWKENISLEMQNRIRNGI